MLSVGIHDCQNNRKNFEKGKFKMTTMEKNNLYDEICHVLTDYEEGKASKEDLYEVLCEVSANWEEITGW